MIDQMTEALMFRVEHQEEVSEARSAVLDAARCFLASHDMSSLIPSDILDKVRTAIWNDEPEKIAYLVRDLASEFVKVNQSEPFWALVDACLFLDDAIGCGWEYMTQERRQSALHCAVLEANWVSHAIRAVELRC